MKELEFVQCGKPATRFFYLPSATLVGEFYEESVEGRCDSHASGFQGVLDVYVEISKSEAEVLDVMFK